MIEIIRITDKNRWDHIVGSFKEYDVYYQSGYVSGFMLHGDGIPCLLHYNSSNLKGICAVFKRRIENSASFDLITPYGYGGFLFEGDTSEPNLKKFKSIFFQKMKEEQIISAFFRYHPLVNNANVVRLLFPIVDVGKTIDMDLESEKVIFKNLTSKNRNMIRKAQKNEIIISYGKGPELFDQFIPIYNATMDRDNASSYYYFSKQFYASIDQFLNDNYLIFYAEYKGQIIAISIILFANKFIHYHLSGSLAEYRHLAPTNLLLYEVALWGLQNGYKKFHLGGGVGSDIDNLFKFKQSFNRYSSNQFSIGKLIFDQEKYDQLVEERIKKNPSFNKESQFFPLYRV